MTGMDGIATLEAFADAGITVIERGNGSETLHKLSNYHYAKIEAEERDSAIRMYNCGGNTVLS